MVKYRNSLSLTTIFRFHIVQFLGLNYETDWKLTSSKLQKHVTGCNSKKFAKLPLLISCGAILRVYDRQLKAIGAQAGRRISSGPQAKKLDLYLCLYNSFCLACDGALWGTIWETIRPQSSPLHLQHWALCDPLTEAFNAPLTSWSIFISRYLSLRASILPAYTRPIVRLSISWSRI